MQSGQFVKCDNRGMSSSIFASLALVLLYALKAVSQSIYLSYLLVRTRAVIGQFSGAYSPARPAKI